ncbi:MAG: response regulator transcription factor [Solirubrobacterales bacterium]
MTRILVADDSETVLLMLQRRLELAGYEVVTASDGHRTLEAMAAAEAPDLVLLDAMMPGKSGIEALRELRASGDRTPVLIVSASSFADEPEQALQAGADGCVPKPFDWDELLGKIEALTS